MKGLHWIGSGVALILVGLVAWYTAWVAWPLAVVLVIINIVLWVREGRDAKR